MKKLALIATLFASVSMYAAMTAPDAAPTAPTWPANQVKAVYSPTYGADCNFGEWGSGTAYSQESFGKKFVTKDLGYFGLEFTGMNCSSMQKLNMAVWIAADASIRIVPIHGGAEVGVTKELKGQQWNYIEIALNEFDGVTNWTNVYQIKIDNAKNLTFWLNEIYFSTSVAPAVDNTAPSEVSASLASASYFSLDIKAKATDASGAVHFDVKLDDAVVASANAASGAEAVISVKNLLPNKDYSFSVVASDESGNKAAPVAVSGKTMVAPAPAAAPTYPQSRVLALYSDIYDNLAYGIQDWWSGPAISYGPLSSSSNAMCINPTGIPAGGCFGMAFAKTDVSKYEALEMDVYPTVANAAIKIQVIGIGEAKSFKLEANKWNHIVLDIKGNTKTDCEQVGFYDCDQILAPCFVQNILFVAPKTSAVENIQNSAISTQKVIENGQLIIIKDGVRYNANGTILK